MSDLDGKSEIASMEPITVSILSSEPGGEGKTIIHRSPKLSGEINCRAFTLITGYEEPRAYFITDCGTFHIKLTDSQIALFVEDGAAFISKKIRSKGK